MFQLWALTARGSGLTAKSVTSGRTWKSASGGATRNIWASATLMDKMCSICFRTAKSSQLSIRSSTIPTANPTAWWKSAKKMALRALLLLLWVGQAHDKTSTSLRMKLC